MVERRVVLAVPGVGVALDRYEDEEGLVPQLDVAASRHSAVWRGLVLLKCQKLDGTLGVLVATRGSELRAEVRAIRSLLRDARVLATDGCGSAPGRPRRGQRLAGWWYGGPCDQAWRHVHEAEARVTALLPDGERRQRMAAILFDARAVLEPGDPLLALQPEQVAQDATPEKARELVRRYRQVWDDRYIRSRAYRNRLIILTAVVTLFIAVLVTCAATGILRVEAAAGGGALRLDPPAWGPSFAGLVTAAGIATLGAAGGLLAGARQVTEVGGVYNPFFLPWHSLALKIQMGALCGTLGVLIMLAGIVPEVRLGRWLDVVLWALVFGATQQLVTTLVDKKVSNLVTSTPQQQVTRK